MEKKKTQKSISCLTASQTALFYGTGHRTSCSSAVKRAYRRHVRENLRGLLSLGITTILVEISTLYGYYALEELTRQRKRAKFTLIAFTYGPRGFDWLHIKNEKLADMRGRKNLYRVIRCDQVFAKISSDEWRDLLCHHSAVIVTNSRYWYVNRDIFTVEQRV